MAISIYNMAMRAVAAKIVKTVKTADTKKKAAVAPFLAAFAPAATKKTTKKSTTAQKTATRAQSINLINKTLTALKKAPAVNIFHPFLPAPKPKPKPKPVPKPRKTPPPPPPKQEKPVVERISKFAELEKSNIREVNKRIRPQFENFAKNFSKDEPEILFISEYMVEDEFAGALLVWEKYYDASHYEVFKKNLFQPEADFERILFLDSQNLAEETGKFWTYIKDELGMDELDQDETYVILDHAIKEDRIYEYKVSASRVPKNPNEIDFDQILESQELLNKTTLSEDNTATIFDFAGQSLGSEDMAWVVSLVNERGFRFFGRRAAEKPLVKLIGQPNDDDGEDFVAFTPKFLSDVVTIIEDSISLFEIKPTFEKMVNVMGGLPKEFTDMFLTSIDETRNVFSYSKFREEIESKVPVFQMILEIAESTSEGARKKLSKLDIKVPGNEGSDSLTTVEGITRVFKYVNEMSLAVLYSQDEDTFEKLKQIHQDIEDERAAQEEDALNTAASEVRDEIEKQVQEQREVPPTVGSFWNIATGKKQVKKPTKPAPTPIIATSKKATTTTTTNLIKNLFGFRIK